MFSKSKPFAVPFALVVATFVTGCSGNVDTVSGEWIGYATEAVMDGPADPSGESVILRNSNDPTTRQTESAMRGLRSPSGQSVILPNSLDPAALQPTDLGLHPLEVQSMSLTTEEELTGPEGTLLRKLLKYAVECALAANDRFELHWVDANGVSHQSSYVGARGIAPNWKTQALSETEQELVSACLAGRTNWYGEEVEISMRGSSPALTADSDEKALYTKREGAFWGNLFSPTPFLRACYDSENVLYSRSVHRDCAAGHDENGTVIQCGMIDIVGSCQQTCPSGSTDGYYSKCKVLRDDLPPGAQTHQVITTFNR